MIKIVQKIPEKQQGVVLIVSLMILLVLTIIGVTALTSSIFQEKMALNAQERSVAFHAAETAIRRAEEEELVFTEAEKLGMDPVSPATRNFDNYNDITAGAGVTSSTATITLGGISALPLGFSSGRFEALQFDIRGDGRRSGSQAAVSNTANVAHVTNAGGT